MEIGEEEWSLENIRRQQDACSVLKTGKELHFKYSTTTGDSTLHGKEFSTWHKLLPRLTMGTDLVLCYENPRTKEKLVVLPSSLGQRIFRMLHDEMGHLGSIKTLERIRPRYFWPSMASDIMNWCKTCIPCQQRRNPVPRCRAPLQSIVMSQPGEVVAMDIVEYTKSSRGSRYCLVMTDHFTKWLELFPLRNQKSETIAKKIMDGWIPHHRAPEQLHSDQGSNLNGKLIKEICSWPGIGKPEPLHSTPNQMGWQKEVYERLMQCLQKQFRTIKRIGTYTCHLPVWHITQRYTIVQSTLLAT